MSSSLAAEARVPIANWLQRCDILYEQKTYSNDIFQACYDDIVRRLSDATGTPPTQVTMDRLKRWIEVGTADVLGYDHLPTHEEKVFVASYTTLMACLDDVHKEDGAEIAAFQARLMNNEPQQHPLLKAFATLIREIPTLWEPTSANIIVTSTLNFLNALSLEDKIQTRSVEV